MAPSSSVKSRPNSKKKGAVIIQLDEDLEMSDSEFDPVCIIPQGDLQLNDSGLVHSTLHPSDFLGTPSHSPSKLALEELSSPGMEAVASKEQGCPLTPILPEDTFCEEVRCAAPAPPMLWAGRLPNLPANWTRMGRSLPSESLGAMLDAIAKQAAIQEVVGGPGPLATRQEAVRSNSSQEQDGRSDSSKEQAGRGVSSQEQAALLG